MTNVRPIPIEMGQCAVCDTHNTKLCFRDHTTGQLVGKCCVIPLRRADEFLTQDGTRFGICHPTQNPA